MLALNSIKEKVLLFFSLILVLFVRLGYLFFVAPQSLNQDEAAILLNARFIVESGKDEWGSTWPIVFQSFGDAKLAGYVWFSSISGLLFQWSWWSVRLPSLFAGIVMMGIIFLIGKRLFSARTGIFSVLLLLASPWSWHYGTLGYEANVGLLFFLLAFYGILTAKFWWHYFFIAVFTWLALVTYNAPLLLLPFLILFSIVWHWNKKERGVFSMISVFIAFLAAVFLTFAANSQKTGVLLFQNAELVSLYPHYRSQFSGIWQMILGNQYVYFGLIVMRNFVNSWSWEFLVQKGGANPWHTIPHLGHLNFLIPVFAALSIGAYVKTVIQGKSVQKKLITLVWLCAPAIALFPAVLTVDAPHATRSLFFFVWMTLSAGYAVSLIQTRWIVGLLSFLGLTSVIFWFISAPILWQKQASDRWNIGLREALESSEVQQADSVYIIDPNGTLYPYVAITENMSYEQFNQQIVRSQPDTVGLVRGEKLGKYEFVFSVDESIVPPNSVLLRQQGSYSWDIIKL